VPPNAELMRIAELSGSHTGGSGPAEG